MRAVMVIVALAVLASGCSGGGGGDGSQPMGAGMTGGGSDPDLLGSWCWHEVDGDSSCHECLTFGLGTLVRRRSCGAETGYWEGTWRIEEDGSLTYFMEGCYGWLSTLETLPDSYSQHLVAYEIDGDTLTVDGETYMRDDADPYTRPCE